VLKKSVNFICWLDVHESSTFKVQQGDLLERALLALTIHLFLIDFAKAILNIEIAVYTDNILSKASL
jgi:hypothetical protein